MSMFNIFPSVFPLRIKWQYSSTRRIVNSAHKNPPRKSEKKIKVIVSQKSWLLKIRSPKIIHIASDSFVGALVLLNKQSEKKTAHYSNPIGVHRVIMTMKRHKRIQTQNKTTTTTTTTTTADTHTKERATIINLEVKCYGNKMDRI